MCLLCLQESDIPLIMVETQYKYSMKAKDNCVCTLLLYAYWYILFITLLELGIYEKIKENFIYLS